MQTFEERIKEMKAQGIQAEFLLSDWCLDCRHSNQIIPDRFHGGGICQTGCSGVAPFTEVDGKRMWKGDKPLGYEKDPEVEVEI